jgi:hypothetical protein
VVDASVVGDERSGWWVTKRREAWEGGKLCVGEAAGVATPKRWCGVRLPHVKVEGLHVERAKKWE